MSDQPMIERAEVGTTKLRLEFRPIPKPKKITEEYINKLVADEVRRKAEEQPHQASSQTETGLSPTANSIVESAHATIINRLKNLVPEKARHAARLFIGKAALTASGLYILISSGCGNVEKQNVPPPPTPTPAASELPEGMPSSASAIEFVPTTETSTAAISSEIPPSPTPTPEPTPMPKPTSTLKPTSINIPQPTEAPIPSSTSTPSSETMPTSIQEQNPSTVETTSYLESKTIDSMETYGADKPLNQSQLAELYRKLNSVEREIRDDTYYGTIFVAKTAYDNLPTSVENDNLQKFIKRHEDFFNQMVNKQPYPGTNKLSIRRLVVVEDGLGTPRFSLNEFLKDSDGGWNIESTYTPTQAAYYDKSLQIDYGLLHELGHAIFHLPDQYTLDFDSKEQSTSVALKDIPIQWRSYFASRRNDIGSDLMNNQGHRIGLHANLQLLRRMLQKDVHDSKKTVPEASWNFPYEIPEKTTFAFGGDYANATVDIFRSTEVDADKRPSHYSRKKKLELIGNYVNSENGNLTLTRDTLFPFPNNKNNLIESENSTLLLRITTKDGKNYFRWMDIRDFNIPYWQGYKEHVAMSFNLASEKDDPKSFDWTIKYSNGNPNTAPV